MIQNRYKINYYILKYLSSIVSLLHLPKIYTNPVQKQLQEFKKKSC